MRNWVLMTAMPPTLGHASLIAFARNFNGSTQVVLNTQPDEPFGLERYLALRVRYANDYLVQVHRYDQFIQQNPRDENDDAFWKMWRDMLYGYGMQPGDRIIASELYGLKLAEVCNCEFFPYDISRHIRAISGENVRVNPMLLFRFMIPEFQNFVRKRITIFGNESIGKTTTSMALRSRVKGGGYWQPEWARPYLETVGNELNDDVMTNIWQGQKALQASAGKLAEGYPFIIQDTDLYSTIGYWEMWSKDTVPEGLYVDASILRSDLYIVLSSEGIPFEPDPLRYGGDKRETTDQYWIDLLERHNLPYIVITESNFDRRVELSCEAAETIFPNMMYYRER